MPKNHTRFTARMIVARRPKKVARMLSGTRSAIHDHQPETVLVIRIQLTTIAPATILAPSGLSPPCAAYTDTPASTNPSSRCSTCAAVHTFLRVVHRLYRKIAAR